jgi:hypothetical protein
MVTYFLTINHVFSRDPKVLAHVIPTMQRAQGLLGTLEIVSDCQPLLTLRVLAIIEPINIVYLGTIFKCNNIKIELTMKEKCYRPISVYKELTFVKFGWNTWIDHSACSQSPKLLLSHCLGIRTRHHTVGFMIKVILLSLKKQLYFNEIDKPRVSQTYLKKYGIVVKLT